MNTDKNSSTDKIVGSTDGLADKLRLEWLIKNSAWVGWTKDGEHCRVWTQDSDDTDLAGC